MRRTPILSLLRRLAPAVTVAALATALPSAAGARGPGGVGVGVGIGGFGGGLGGIGVGGFGGPAAFGGFRGGGGVFVPRVAPIAPFVAARPFGASPLVPPLFDVRPFGFAPPGGFGFGGFGAPFGFAPRSGFGFVAPGALGFGSGFGYGPAGSLGFGYGPPGSFGFGTPSFGTAVLVPRGRIVAGVGGAFPYPPLTGGATVAFSRAAPGPLPVRPPAAPVPAQVWRRDNGVWHLDTATAPVAAWRLGDDGRWRAAAVR